VRRRHSPATTAARRRSDAGGAGFARGKGWEEGGGRGEAHHALESGGGGPEVEIDGRGRSSTGASMAAGDGGSIPAGKRHG